jgi:hypothetical protein
MAQPERYAPGAHGRIDVRFADTTLIDLAAGGTPVDLEFAYTLSAQAKLVLTVHEVPAQTQARGRGSGRRAGELRLPRGQERWRRSDAHGDAHQRSRRDGVRMIDLSQPAAPYELELPYGLKVTVRPLTTAGIAAAQAAARRAVEAIDRQARERTEAGLPLAVPAGWGARVLPGVPRRQPALRPRRAPAPTDGSARTASTP